MVPGPIRLSLISQTSTLLVVIVHKYLLHAVPTSVSGRCTLVAHTQSQPINQIIEPITTILWLDFMLWKFIYAILNNGISIELIYSGGVFSVNCWNPLSTVMAYASRVVCLQDEATQYHEGSCKVQLIYCIDICNTMYIIIQTLTIYITIYTMVLFL